MYAGELTSSAFFHLYYLGPLLMLINVFVFELHRLRSG